MSGTEAVGLLYESEHWRLSHRRDSRYPGSLILAARDPATDLSDLPAPALATLGPSLAFAERLLQRCYRPLKVIHYKLGFSAGYACHFHVVPVTQALLEAIRAHPHYADEPDGNDAIMFLSREYGERALTPDELVKQTLEIERLRRLAAILAV